MRYKILEASDITVLEHQVEEYSRMQYRCQGGVSTRTAVNDNGEDRPWYVAVFTQAMVHDET